MLGNELDFSRRYWKSHHFFSFWENAWEIHLFRKSWLPGKRNSLHRCVKKFMEVNKPRFACVSLGKCRFWLISFDVPFWLKRNLEGNIVSLVAGTYPNFKKFYTSENEKSPENHLSLRKRKQKRIWLPPLLKTEESRKYVRAYIFWITGMVYCS